MKFAEVKTVIWDLDGTLLNSFELFIDITTTVLTRRQLPIPDHDAFLKHFHGTLNETFKSLIPSLSASQLREFTAEFLVEQNNHYKVVEQHLYEDAVQLGLAFNKRGAKQIIVTNRAHEGRGNASPIHIVQHSRLVNFIDHVITGDEGVHRKPKPTVVDMFLKDGTIKPNITLVIGDQFVDAEFAHNLHAKGLLVDRTKKGIMHLEKLGNGWEEHVTIVDSLDEMI